jgi:hypothetical protein
MHHGSIGDGDVRGARHSTSAVDDRMLDVAKAVEVRDGKGQRRFRPATSL